MSTTLHEPQTRAGYRILIEPATWKSYKQTLAELDAKGRRYRSTYSDGVLEVIVPGNIHEAVKNGSSRLLETYSLATGFEIMGMGSTTFSDELAQKGLEPGECYYVNRSPQPLSKQINDIDPIDPPDLAIEVDVARSSVPREPVYAALGVRELWRWKDGRFTLLELVNGRYVVTEASRLVPDLDFAAFEQFVKKTLDEPGRQTAIAREYFDWLTLSNRPASSGTAGEI
jgi:Uma2 family endonuclease